MPVRLPLRRFALGLASAIALAQPVSAQDCIIIERIFINNQSVFDTSDMEDDSRLLGLYNFANSLHWQTSSQDPVQNLHAHSLFETQQQHD